MHSSKVFTLFRGMRCIDGGVTVNTPLLDEKTFLVSPFPSIPVFMNSLDVCPYRKFDADGLLWKQSQSVSSPPPPLPVPFQTLLYCALVPDPVVLQDLFDHGRVAADHFIEADPAVPVWRQGL
jgi:hypothetical protein